jgi:hypothetical protein
MIFRTEEEARRYYEETGNNLEKTPFIDPERGTQGFYIMVPDLDGWGDPIKVPYNYEWLIFDRLLIPETVLFRDVQDLLAFFQEEGRENIYTGNKNDKSLRFVSHKRLSSGISVVGSTYYTRYYKAPPLVRYTIDSYKRDFYAQRSSK